MVVGMIVIATTSKSGSGLFMLISVPIMITSFAASLATYFSQKRKVKRISAKREERYNEVLDKYSSQLEDAAHQQKRALHQIHPSPRECMGRLEKMDRRLWERSPKDGDFLATRLGLGEQLLALEVKVPDQEVAIEPDPLIIRAQQLKDEVAVLDRVPITLPLKEAGISGVAGPREAVLTMVREMTIELATNHSPDEVKILAVFPGFEREQWQWMRWLPHCWSEDRTRRLLADDRETAHSLLSSLYEILSRRQLQQQMTGVQATKETPIPFFVVFLADPELAENEPVMNLLLSGGKKLGAATVFLGDSIESLPKGCTMIAQVDGGRCALATTEQEGSVLPFQPEDVDVSFCDKFARSMAPIKLKGLSEVADIPSSLSLLDLCGVSDVEDLNAPDRWSANRPYKSMAVPLGLKSGGKPVVFDLHEKAHGPHGLVAGATGSWKSELLMTLICELALNYHPHEVAFVLVDYKGGGTANAFLELPHVVGVITNLGGNLTTRALIALKSELMSRQKHFADVDVNHIDAYQKKYRDGKAKVPLPHLILIIDEFAELVSEQPDFINELISAVRVGRSLGVHLILATQKPAGVVNEQIWGNTRFRLCLRVERPEDSRDVIKRTDAANITLPGRCYLQVGSNEIFELFQSAYGGLQYAQASVAGEDTKICEVALDGSRLFQGRTRKQAGQQFLTQIQAVEKYLHGVAEGLGLEPLPGPWLPPLPETVFLDDLLEGYQYGWDGHEWREPNAWIEPIVGLLDNPAGQAQVPLGIPIGIEGHLLVLGVPGCGKTTLLQTMIRSLTTLYSPDNLNIYILDFGGRTMNLFSRLPHVGGVVLEDDEEKVRALFKFLLRELEKRKGLFAGAGVNTLSAYRSATGDLIPAIVVFLDNYSNFITQYMDDLEDVLAKLVQEGGSTGIHFVITATGPTQVRTKVGSNISLAVALELSERGEYNIVVGRTGGLYPTDVPGRGLVKASPPLEFQTALPVYGDTEAERASNMKDYSESVAVSWKGDLAPEIPMVPEEVDLASVLLAVGEGVGEKRTRAYIGLDAESVEPVEVDLENGPHFLVTGPPQCGKTTLLQTWLLSLCQKTKPEDLRLFLVDFGLTSLSPLRKLPHVESYANTSDGFEEMLKKISEVLKERKASMTSGGRSEEGGAGAPGGGPLMVMVIDDFYLFKESVLSEATDELERIIRRERGLGFHLLLASTNSDIASCWDGYAKALLELQTGFLLGTTDHDDLQIFKLRMPSEIAGQALPAGLGYFAKRGRSSKVKVAMPQGESMSLADWVKKIRGEFERGSTQVVN